MTLSSSRRADSVVLALVALASVFLAGPAAATGKTGQVTVFWGRNKAEGSLREACDTGTYTIVVISFLSVFGHGKYDLDISGHPVAGLGADIKHCQSNGHLVYLSIGGFGNGYSLPSPKAAEDFADYLWFSYLAGTRPGTHRPFGDAYVDGIDFFIEHGPPDNYDVLARRLWAFNKGFRARTPVQLMATPRCRFPDRGGIGRALATGLVGRINVRMYGEGYCAAYWQPEWDKWTKAYPDAQVYVGLPASEQEVGYVHPKNLFYGVVPVVQKAANYGGIMIWERFADKQTKYSSYAIQWA
jgi:chitinase